MLPPPTPGRSTPWSARAHDRWRIWLRSGVGLALMAGLAAGCGGDAAPTAAPASPVVAPDPVESDVKVVVLGDSIAAGLGLPVDQAFPAVVQSMLRADGLSVDVQNAGVSGDTSAAGASRLAWLLKQAPDLLVVELGGNDLLRGQPVEATEARLRDIVTRAQAAGVQVVLLGIRAPGSVGPEHQAAFDSVYSRVAQDTGAAFVPGFLDPLMGKPELLQADGLHPTPAGQRLLAERLVPTLAGLVRQMAERAPGDVPKTAPPAEAPPRP